VVNQWGGRSCWVLVLILMPGDARARSSDPIYSVSLIRLLTLSPSLMQVRYGFCLRSVRYCSLAWLPLSSRGPS
jgi:hypothetical protein